MRSRNFEWDTLAPEPARAKARAASQKEQPNEHRIRGSLDHRDCHVDSIGETRGGTRHKNNAGSNRVWVSDKYFRAITD